MAFGSTRTDELEKAGAGLIVADTGVVSTYTDFEDGLIGGLFAKFKDDKIQNIDGSEDSEDVVCAGIVLAPATGAIEDDGKYTAENSILADAVESGLCTVTVVADVEISKFDKVYVYNNDKNNVEDNGKATPHSADSDGGDGIVANIPIDGYFYKQISDTVWTVRQR
jgi:hypothetical protein